MTDTTVLIVGAGPAGLTAALALQEYGVPFTLIERQAGPAHTPRAHIVNQRTVEIMRHLGLQREIEAASSSHESMRHSIWYTTLNRREVARWESWGTQRDHFARYSAASPVGLLNCPQTRFEPVLIEALESRGGRIEFRQEFVSMESVDGRWRCAVEDRDSGARQEFSADFVIGADGTRARVLSELGLGIDGASGLFHAANIWFRADLSQYFEHRPGVLTWNIHPGPQPPLGLGTFICMEPYQEFVLVRFFDPETEDLRDMTQDEAKAHIERAVGESVENIEILGISGWQVNDQVAPVYGRDGAYCAGDAVHRHPPTNGLGLNMSVADGFNLAWKIALVHRGLADRALLETYTQERQPVGQAGVARAIQSLRDAAAFRAAIGLDDDMTEAEGWDELAVLDEPSERGDRRRAALRDALRQTDYRFNALGLEVGYRYARGAVVDDSFSPEPTGDPVLDMPQSTRPGYRVPHARLERNGRQISSIDLVDGLQFALIAGLDAEHWRKAASQVSEDLGVEIVVHQIPGPEILDPYFEWADVREVGHDGAVLVRPDRHVAWRSVDRPADPTAALRDALSQLLRR